jgi:inner membrane protein
MMAGSHVTLGAAAWIVAAPHLGLPAFEPIPLGLSVIGSLLPDIDHPKSWVGRRARPISTIISALFGHRGLTHSLLAVIGCALLLRRDGLPLSIVAPLAVGYLSHLGGDLLTPRGLRLAWPLKGTWALPLCRAGSPLEPIVVAAMLCWAGSSIVTPAELVSDLCRLTGPDLTTFCSAQHAPAQRVVQPARGARQATIAGGA